MDGSSLEQEDMGLACAGVIGMRLGMLHLLGWQYGVW